MISRINLRHLITLLSIFAIVSIISVSCKKEQSNDEAEQRDISMATGESDAEAETIFNGIFDDVVGVSDDVGMGGIGIFARSAGINNTDMSARPTGCFTVSVVPIGIGIFPKTVTIDFGTTSCLGADGHTRRGKIVTVYTNRLTVPGAVATTTFQDFYIDSIRVQGTHKLTNTSSPINTQPLTRSFKVQVIDAKLTKHNGNFIEWNSTKTVSQIEGLLTPDMPRDDMFKLEGNSRGRAQRGNLLVVWESSVIEPLIKKFLCRWIAKGVIKTVRGNATTNNQWMTLLNFGPGTCDNRANLTINGVTIEITLR
jgi:hypothetical protein